jgi:sugar-specific transcriptional regulator TrmB
MKNNYLSASGLDEKESLAYMALLELGEATMSELTKKSGLKRSTLYFLVEALHKKRLVSIVKKGKKTVYSAEDPKRLLEQADENRRNLEYAMPELLSIANNIVKKPKVRFFEGEEGIKEVYKDILRFPDQKMYAWLSESMITDFDPAFIADYYNPNRLQKRIWAEVIASDTSVGREFKANDLKALRKTKLLGEAEFPLSIEISLYGKDRIGFMSMEDKLGLIVESKPIADTLRSLFAYQWKHLAE